MINHYYLLHYYCLAFSSFFCYFHSQMDNSPPFSLRCLLLSFGLFQQNYACHLQLKWSEWSHVGSLRRVKYLLVIANFTHCHCCSLKFVSPQGASGPKQLLAYSFLLKRFVQILEGLTNCVVLYMRTENIYILFETQSHKQLFCLLW